MYPWVKSKMHELWLSSFLICIQSFKPLPAEYSLKGADMSLKTQESTIVQAMFRKQKEVLWSERKSEWNFYLRICVYNNTTLQFFVSWWKTRNFLKSRMISNDNKLTFWCCNVQALSFFYPHVKNPIYHRVKHLGKVLQLEWCTIKNEFYWSSLLSVANLGLGRINFLIKNAIGCAFLNNIFNTSARVI